jgi:hypothetical protein
VKNSKVSWVATGVGTEAGGWGEKISLPVNAPGDIIIEANLRLKRTSAFAIIGIGVNHGAATTLPIPRYGCQIYDGPPNMALYGINNGAYTVPIPARPSQTNISVQNIADMVATARVIRKNNYLFMYLYGFYLGSYAFASTITTVDIVTSWWQPNVGEPSWCDYISVWPREYVLGGP